MVVLLKVVLRPLAAPRAGVPESWKPPNIFHQKAVGSASRSRLGLTKKAPKS